ncbi:MAG: PD40 domain-containing protein [Bacteroidales bacterium]|nr:PD40 domain-containing protein [Bacteroidales bacterium]
MKRIYTIIFAALVSSACLAQKPCSLPKVKGLEQKYDDAVYLLRNNQDIGIKYLTDITIDYPKYYPATLILGEYYLKKQIDAQLRFQTDMALQFSKLAQHHLSLSFEFCPTYDSCRASFYLGECYYLDRKFDQAERLFNNFLDNDYSAPSCRAKAQKRLDMIKEYYDIISHPVKFNPRELQNICTSDDEYLPMISPDGELFLFTRRHVKRNGDFSEQIVLSTKIHGNDTVAELYTVGDPLPAPFNQGKLQGGACFTVDNRILYVTICDHEDCDIYYSANENGVWQPLIKLPNTVNTDLFDGQPTVDATGNTIYFSSNRPGGYGGYDIYKIVRHATDSLWSSPINLGPKINTEFDEKTPFIHSDNKTLYFASNGHGGLGGFDIFVSRLDDMSRFSKPKNIGFPINTEGDEVAYVVSADGKRIYFSSKMLSGKGGWDIYCSDLPPEASPNQVLLIKGKITNEKGEPVPNVSIDLTGLKTFETAHDETKKNGEYAVSTQVNDDEEYLLTIKKKGFFYNMQVITPDSVEYVPPTYKDIRIDKIQTGIPVVLENVNFEFNSAKLSPSSEAVLRQLALFFAEYPQYKIELGGHTDAVGNNEFNMVLSEKRCRTVYNYLVMVGIDPKRLTYRAFGKTTPVAPNTTSEGRALNRRVEFVLYE